MNWSAWIKQLHRWMAVVFTASVIATSIAMAQAKPIVWMSYLPLPPLAVLQITGVYMFVLPYVVRRRGRQSDQT